MLVWRFVGDVSRAKSLYDNWGWWSGLLMSPLVPAAITVLSVVVLLIVRKHDEDYAVAPAPIESVSNPAIIPPAAQQPTLVGKFAHVLNDEGQVKFQVHVLREEDGRLFVQMFSALTGDPTNQRFLTESEVARTNFYNTQEEWLDAYRRSNRD